jgi:rhomboid family GlyGly-CTERM serine protease
MMGRRGRGGAGSEIGDSAHLPALLAVIGIWVAIQCGGDALHARLRYERTAVAAGEWWRLLTAHFVHFDLRHLAFNSAGLVLLWALFAWLYPARSWLVIAVCALLAVDAGLWLQQPAVQWYLGASGLLHGLWSAGGWERWRREGWAGSPALLALALKLLLEQGRATSLVVGDMPVVLPAHLYGAIGGLLWPLCLQLQGMWRARPL